MTYSLKSISAEPYPDETFVKLKTVQLEESDGIAYLTLNRRPKNEMDALFFNEFVWLARDVLPNLKVKGMIIQGSGRHFSSGTEMAEFKNGLSIDQTPDKEKLFMKNVASFQILSNLSLPVVAVVRGCCIGSGMELALACHFRIAGPNAMFALPETQFGLMPGCGGTIRLQELVGRGRAIELILTGRSLLAEKAREYGLIDYISPNKDLLKSAELLIRQVISGKNPGMAVSGRRYNIPKFLKSP